MLSLPRVIAEAFFPCDCAPVHNPDCSLGAARWELESTRVVYELPDGHPPRQNIGVCAW